MGFSTFRTLKVHISLSFSTINLFALFFSRELNHFRKQKDHGSVVSKILAHVKRVINFSTFLSIKCIGKKVWMLRRHSRQWKKKLKRLGDLPTRSGATAIFTESGKERNTIVEHWSLGRCTVLPGKVSRPFALTGTVRGIGTVFASEYVDIILCFHVFDALRLTQHGNIKATADHLLTHFGQLIPSLWTLNVHVGPSESTPA